MTRATAPEASEAAALRFRIPLVTVTVEVVAGDAQSEELRVVQGKYSFHIVVSCPVLSL